MRLTGLLAARESLIAEGTAINSVADNLANFNTTGFKAERAEFQNLLAASEGNLMGSPLEPGNGVKIEELRTLHDKQGTFDFTDRGTDLAIDGKGFFNVSDGTTTYYTRAGNFNIDNDGNLVTGDGLKVLGLPATTTATGTGTTGTTTGAATPTALNVKSAAGTATASTTATLGGNLNTGSATVTVPAATDFKTLSDSADFNTPITVIDSLGAPHDVTLYFFHTGTAAQRQYTVSAYVDGTDVGGVAGTPTPVGTTTVNFQADGTQAAGATTSLAIAAPWSNGANASAVAVDLSKMTGFASSSALSNVSVNGNRAGSPTGYEVLKDGTLNVILDTGDRATVGTVVLSRFQNQDGLEKVGGNKFRAGDDVGDVSTGAASADGRGDIRGGALENSTVDPSNEFIDLLRFQRGYQAGSQVITTISQLLSTTINIKG
ncbi:MAG: flagellar hook-basal body complex protein [Bdellovibrionota bacterium]